MNEDFIVWSSSSSLCTRCGTVGFFVATLTRLTLAFALPRRRQHAVEVLGDVLTEQFEHVGLVGRGVSVDFWGEGEGDDAGDAGAELEDGGLGVEE